MNGNHEGGRKPVDTYEWYDFVAQLTDILPELHPGGLDATQRLLEMCHLDESNRVLDIGCGSGSTACLIVEEYGAEVFGIDVSEAMISKAKLQAQQRRLLNRLDFRIADVFDLPFDDHWFDVVIAESVLTPLPGDKGMAMSEIVRVLRPSGLFGVNEGTVDPGISAEAKEVLSKHPAFHGHFTPDAICTLFEESGLKVVDQRIVRDVDLPKPRIGLGDLLKFMVKVYPKLIVRLLRDHRIREARKIDEDLTKGNKDFMGYAIVIGQKSGDEMT
jgi:ubiquinone/menaquinone biosynthesis C-methylase UbiE